MRGDIIYVNRLPLGVKACTSIRENPESCFLDRLIFRFLTYKHYGIDVGDNQIIHFHCSSIINIHKGIITLCSPEEFSKDGIIQVDHAVVSLYSPEEVALRAESMLYSNFDGYHITTNNCEHFSMWCATGLRIGKQNLLYEAWKRSLSYPSLAKKKALSALSVFTFLQ